MSLVRFFFIFCFFVTTFCYSQLSDFSLNLDSVDESCAGTGSISMSVSNTTTGSQITYNLYLAPDFTNAIAETTTNTFGSLPAGNYRVVATQSLDGITNSQQSDIVIQDLVVDLEYTISYSTLTDCDVTGTITVDVSSGNPVSYEIISGPVIVPEQSSNTFPGLPSGTYIIRVFDNCNDALSKTFTMFLATNSLNISPATLPVIYDSCNSAIATTNILPASGTPIIYPLTIAYTLFPPDGSTNLVTTETITSGSPDALELSNTISLYGEQTFNYEVLITDNCGNEFQLINLIDPNPVIGLELRDAPCSTYYMSLSVYGFLPPYTISFDEAPDDFDASEFNALYPGPITDPVLDFGDEDTPIPFGNYTASIVDSCGRVGTIELLVEETELEPEVGSSSSKCGGGLGFIRAAIPDDRIIVSAIITQAPPSYTEALPSDITTFVDEDGVLIAVLPEGVGYYITVIDDCGFEYIIEEDVPEFVMQPLVVKVLPNCDPGSGSVKVTSGNGVLETLIMTAAPLTYLEALPYDVSFNINNGAMFMSDLPAGSYTFKGVDECGFELEITVNVNGYTPAPESYFLQRNCGSFNVGVTDYDTSVTNQTYWFQRFFPENNSWGHPYTGVTYIEGTIPVSANSISLQNFDVVYNLFLTGDFRIIKVFESYNNGGGNTNCIDVYTKFSTYDKLIINGAYSLDCNGGSGPSDIVLDAIGVAPFSYSITSPYAFDNGNDNIFTGLAPGVYIFKVTDYCGNIENITVEVGNLLPLARANDPESMLVCRNDTNQVGMFVLSDQNLQILGNQNPDDYTVTYHLNQLDANTGNNPLAEAYTNISNPQTIFARVTHNTLGICYATTSFPIFIGNNPILTPTTPVFVCEGKTITLTADPDFDAYEWSTGATTQSITVAQPGIYSVVVKNVYQDFTCDSFKEFTVTGSSIAAFVDINTIDWSSGNNTITVLVSGTGDYVYSLDNINFQPENSFTNLLPGNYTVYVKDLNGCGTINDTFSLLNYPNFFTPNGDGYNDTWNIKFASFEPNLSVNIFDRYGKFIIQLFGNGPGWDGTYNGKPLPSTDYWFVATREDGTVHKGHFALKR